MSNPTDTKLEEMARRHQSLCHKIETGYQYGCMNGMHAHHDRAYLLSRVRELEATLATQIEAMYGAQVERDRLRAILDAPVTDEMLSRLGTPDMQRHDYGIRWWTEEHIMAAVSAFLAARRSK